MNGSPIFKIYRINNDLQFALKCRGMRPNSFLLADIKALAPASLTNNTVPHSHPMARERIAVVMSLCLPDLLHAHIRQ